MVWAEEVYIFGIAGIQVVDKTLRILMEGENREEDPEIGA